ncbi:ABC transporter ATP-binding protein [Leucobacter sp. BZR 635]
MTTSTEAGTRPVLEMNGLSVDFAVDGVWNPAAIGLEYRIRPGEIVAVVGESGSGKSASSMAILDLLPKTARVRGSITLNGEELVGANPRRMRELRGSAIAAIFQEPMTALNPVLTIGSQIVEAVRTHTQQSPSEAKTRAIELLTLVELPDPEKAFNSYPHQLSGGQRQRAMIAQALVLDPQLLIADEPTTALDVTVQAEILELIRSLRDRLKSAVLLITHDMGVVADLADWIVVMQQGRIVEQGDVMQIFTAPQHPYTQALLAAVPHLGGDSEVDLSESLVRVVEDRLHEAVHTEAIAATPGTAVLSFEEVSIEYGRAGKLGSFKAVDSVTFEVNPGEIVGLVGESGSGKSTIGRAATGLQAVSAGRLEVTGTDLSKWNRKIVRELRNRVGIVFQDPSSSLNPRLPIGESIGEPLFLAGEARGKALDVRVEELLDSVNLPVAYRNRFPHELSGGQKQRVGIARALSLKPELLIADEPTSALDVSVQAKVLELLKELQAEMGFACLFISHDLAVVDALADRVIVLHRGKIAEQGTRNQILRAPTDPYTQRLIAAIPVPDPVEQRSRRELRQRILQDTDGV